MCRVCCGIDSQVVGEQEIFGQFKNAYNSAKAFKIIGKELTIYVEKVFEITKKVRTETKIGINPLSVSGLSFKLVKEIIENHCLLYTSPSQRDRQKSRYPSCA